MGAIPPSNFRLPPVFGRAANAAAEVTTKKGLNQAKKVADANVEIENVHERNTYVIDHLASTVSGEAMVRELEQKRNRYLDRIKQVIAKNEKEIKAKHINQETLLRDLEIIAQNLLDRNEKLDEFFKFKVNIEEDIKEECKVASNKESETKQDE